MSDKDFCDSPMNDIGTIPAGYKGSGQHTYNGEDAAAFGDYKRTSGHGGPDEVSYDGNVGPISGETIQK